MRPSSDPVSELLVHETHPKVQNEGVVRFGNQAHFLSVPDQSMGQTLAGTGERMLRRRFTR